MRRARALVALGAWLAFLVAGVVALVRLGDGPLAMPATDDLASWLDVAGPGPAAFALIRLAAIALGGHLIVVTLASIALRFVGADASAATVESLTPARVGLLVRAAVAGSLAVATALPAPAAATGDANVVMRRLPDAPSTSSRDTVVMRRLPDAPPVPSSSAPVAADPPATTWTIEPGDSFWRIAERVLERSWARAPSDREIDPYWRQVIEQNRSVLDDPHNPDLVHPGQRLTLPPPPEPNPASTAA